MSTLSLPGADLCHDVAGRGIPVVLVHAWPRPTARWSGAAWTTGSAWRDASGGAAADQPDRCGDEQP